MPPGERIFTEEEEALAYILSSLADVGPTPDLGSSAEWY